MLEIIFVLEFCCCCFKGKKELDHVSFHAKIERVQKWDHLSVDRMFVLHHRLFVSELDNDQSALFWPQPQPSPAPLRSSIPPGTLGHSRAQRIVGHLF